MFKRLFDFNGRIRRTEYVISSILYLIIWFFCLLATETRGLELIGMFLSLVFNYIYLAQGAKRCHDIGVSGWWQILPFFSIVMLKRKSDDDF